TSNCHGARHKDFEIEQKRTKRASVTRRNRAHAHGGGASRLAALSRARHRRGLCERRHGGAWHDGRRLLPPFRKQGGAGRGSLLRGVREIGAGSRTGKFGRAGGAWLSVQSTSRRAGGRM